jgi:hypothetical protein
LLEELKSLNSKVEEQGLRAFVWDIVEGISSSLRDKHLPVDGGYHDA